jgi:hypothetical protein
MNAWRLRILDRPPELVIGPAKGRTRWRTMTTLEDFIVVMAGLVV